MQFESRACVLHPIGVGSRIASGRCTEKSMISSSARGFPVSKRFDPGCFQVAQPLDVVTKRHHRHPKVGTRLPFRGAQEAGRLHEGLGSDVRVNFLSKFQKTGSVMRLKSLTVKIGSLLSHL
jgi:hypothetical protein